MEGSLVLVSYFVAFYLENKLSKKFNMDDTARGMASKFLCDILNIGKGDNKSVNPVAGDGKLYIENKLCSEGKVKFCFILLKYR